MPTYRIVLSEKARNAKKGSQEILGYLLLNRKEPVFQCKQDRVTYWVSKGAKPSDTLARLLKRAGMPGMEQFMVRYAKQKSKKEVAQDAAKPKEQPAAPAAKKEEQPAAEPVK